MHDVQRLGPVEGIYDGDALMHDSQLGSCSMRVRDNSMSRDSRFFVPVRDV